MPRTQIQQKSNLQIPMYRFLLTYFDGFNINDFNNLCTILSWIFRAFLLFLGSYFTQSVRFLNKLIPLRIIVHIGIYTPKMKYFQEDLIEIFKKLLFCSFHLLIFCSFCALTLQPHITAPGYTRKKRKKRKDRSSINGYI